MNKKPLHERFPAFISPEPNTGCWLWTGELNHSGYGLIQQGYKSLRAHRVSYELAYEKIPEGMVIDHLCRVRSCVNPEHLRVVLNKENLLAKGSLSISKIHADQTHCLRGYEFSGNNLSIFTRPDGSKERRCRTCYSERERNRYRGKKREGQCHQP